MRTWLPAIVVVLILATIGAGGSYVDQRVSLLPMYGSVNAAVTFGVLYGAVLGLVLIGLVALRRWSAGSSGRMRERLQRIYSGDRRYPTPLGCPRRPANGSPVAAVPPPSPGY